MKELLASRHRNIEETSFVIYRPIIPSGILYRIAWQQLPNLTLPDL